MGGCNVRREKRKGLWEPLGVRFQMIIERRPYWEVHRSQLVTYKKKRREKQVLEDKLWFCFQATMNNGRTWKQGLVKGEIIEWKGELSGWGVRFVLEGVGWRSEQDGGAHLFQACRPTGKLKFSILLMCYNLKIITQAQYHWLFQCNCFIPHAATSIQTVLLGLVTYGWRVLLPFSKWIVKNVRSMRKVILLLYLKTDFFQIF